jgi:hypothetical protein
MRKTQCVLGLNGRKQKFQVFLYWKRQVTTNVYKLVKRVGWTEAMGFY